MGDIDAIRLSFQREALKTSSQMCQAYENILKNK